MALSSVRFGGWHLTRKSHACNIMCESALVRLRTANADSPLSQEAMMTDRLPCELCGIKPRLKKRDRCEDCDPWCRQCGAEERRGGSRYCHTCQAARRREWYQNDPDNRARRLASNTAGNIALRNEVYAAYGNKCLCCGESEPLFLTIDHIDGTGADHRRATGRYGGITFYRYLRDIGCPRDNYRLMCWNCNSGRERNNGICPHELYR